MHERKKTRLGSGFTLVELLVTITIIAMLASLLMSAVAAGKSKARSASCLGNERQLILAWFLYASDFNDALPYNLGADDIKRGVSKDRYWNWTSSIMSWELDADNTNTALLTRGGLGPYTASTPQVYRCPSDFVVSDLQAQAGWRSRTRSISMNAMVGDAGTYSKDGINVNNPEYQQFFKLAQISRASDLFVFVEEHPDSINDGYFLNKPDTGEWTDLPASYHNGGANFAFADGHMEAHRWLFPSTKPPSKPDSALLPFRPPASDQGDFDWTMRRTSEEAVR